MKNINITNTFYSTTLSINELQLICGGLETDTINHLNEAGSRLCSAETDPLDADYSRIDIWNIGRVYKALKLQAANLAAIHGKPMKQTCSPQ